MLRSLAAPLCLAAGVLAQAGDKKGEAQPEPPAELRLPQAAALSPEEALASFTIEPGLRVELAAAEPLIAAPVAIDFDARGRLWVVEMRGYMRDADGTGEHEPLGRVVVLADDDGDGRYDASQTFLDGLVLPRGVLVVEDGALVILPPKLVFCRDTDGDGKADRQEVVLDKGFEAGLTNPEHAGNSLLRGVDNWIYLANFGQRLRREGQGWRVEPATAGGQWGLSQDDWGRRFYNYNSDWLRADLYPSHYAMRNGALGVATGANLQLSRDQKTWPGRLTPGINRGYQKPMLREGRLAVFTATCAPCVYRGDLLPEPCRGSVFVCEPSGNFVRRAVLEPSGDGQLGARNALEARECLTSTDERFRPVNLANGPDGALYVVDLYRGILQHKNFLTTFLRRQIAERELAAPLDRGRIWRIMPAGVERRPRVTLAPLAPAELVPRLADANGWVRDTAQRLLVERRDLAIVPALDALLREAKDPRARLHALWTLEGLGQLSAETLAMALGDGEPQVRAAALRLSEGGLTPALVAAASADPVPAVRWQLALSLGTSGEAGVPAALAQMVRASPLDAVLLGAALSGLAQRELPFLEALLAEPPPGDALAPAAKLTARTVCRARRGPEILALAERAAEAAETPAGRALLDGMLAALPTKSARAGYFRLPAAPERLQALAKTSEPARTLLEAMRWPGSAPGEKPPRKLTPAEERLVLLGKAFFATSCATCHQTHGQGQDGLAPSLIDSEFVLGPAERQIRIVLHGLQGPVEMGGKTQSMTMEPVRNLTDRQIAAILTYTRRAWGHAAEPVAPEQVTAVRESTKERDRPWTRDELRAIE